MITQEFFDKYTSTLTYIVFDEKTKDGLVIDPVLDYSVNSSSLSKTSIKKVTTFIKDNNIKLHYILETHAHADHISGAYELKKYFPESKTAINEKITVVQETFSELFNLPQTKTDGSQFDKLLTDGEKLKCGSIDILVISTPGHTPACSSFLIDDMLFCGDALFMPELGCARCDFPKGSAEDLYNSIVHKIYPLGDDINIMTGHDYPKNRDYLFKSTISEHKASNKMIPDNISVQEFIKKREERDQSLDAPRLLLPSLQINIEAGKLPKKETNGSIYLKIPLNLSSDLEEENLILVS